MVLSGSDDVLDERVGPQLLADLRIVFGPRTELAGLLGTTWPTGTCPSCRPVLEPQTYTGAGMMPAAITVSTYRTSAMPITSTLSKHH